MNTYENMKKVIANPLRKQADEELLNMCDIFLMNKRLLPDQYNELIAMINVEWEP